MGRKVSELSPEEREKLRRIRARRAAQESEAKAADGSKPVPEGTLRRTEDVLREGAEIRPSGDGRYIVTAPGLDAKGRGAVNPWLDSRRRYAAQKDKCRVHMLTLICLVLFLAAGLLYNASVSMSYRDRPAVMPWLLVMDAAGQVVNLGPVARPPEGNENLYGAFMSEFISRLRRITVDYSVMDVNTRWVFAYLQQGDPAYIRTVDYYRQDATNPYARAEKELTDIQIRSVIRQTDRTYEISWTETVRDHKGGLLRQDVPYRALVTFERGQVSGDPQVFRYNPMGLVIKDYSFQEVR